MENNFFIIIIFILFFSLQEKNEVFNRDLLLIIMCTETLDWCVSKSQAR